MIFLDYLISIIWLSPFAYISVLLLGKFYNARRRRQVRSEGAKKNIEKIIYQVPTIGNAEMVNKTLETVKNYGLPVELETWVIIEEWDTHKDEYRADKVVVVPSSFECQDLYKSRALEYARRLRQKMVKEGSLTPNYMLFQGDDDSRPSKEFMEEGLTVDADVMIGTIAPTAKGVLSTIIDYERCVACGMFCNFFTNIEEPIWAHGEGTCMVSKVDQTVSYDLSDYTSNSNIKLISSEDLFYLQKASLKGFTTFNSEKKIFIISPLDFKDAVVQRRRWTWGQLRILRFKLLPLKNRLRLAVFGYSGLWLYALSTLGVPLKYLGLVSIPDIILPFTYATLILWFVIRAYTIGKIMGWKHAIAGVLASYVTVTLNFLLQIVGLIKGDPKKFEVIRKQ
jgi:hypothetical protein